MAANMLAAATTTLGYLAGAKSSALSAYIIQGSSSTTTSNEERAEPFRVGLWKVVRARHRTTGRQVSVWSWDKRPVEAVEAMKKEATSLSKLRHPDLLHMLENLEETRTEMSFVTEELIDSLGGVLQRMSNESRGRQREEELDEVEIQKGVLQLARALGFLHQNARLVHLNINPEAVLINAKGDWKLSGLMMTASLGGHGASPMQAYVYPEFDSRLPPYAQFKYDYLAPEYALDSSLSPQNDMFSLGCLLYAVHLGGRPPFRTHNSLQGLRDCVERELVTGRWKGGAKWTGSSNDLKDLLSKLITRTPQTRLSLASLASHPYFASSLVLNILTFLDPTNFASKSREEKATFLKGLLRVLPGFSEKLRRRKLLPGLLDEMKDHYLVPFLLPNVLEICKSISTEEFANVLARLQPLFVLKDSPQNLIALLESLPLFKEKTTSQQFKDDVMPLIYHSLESDTPSVQERALKAIPALCEDLPYDVLEQVLLVKVAILFTKTRILSVKVSTLECFLSMVPALTQTVLTQKLVPLLAKIRTKEPSVMMATLNVHEAMGMKVDREAVAGLVLPQLWMMSMGPLLSVDQFSKFMSVIKSLGARVEREHIEHLRAVRTSEAQTASLGLQNSGWELGQESAEVDFETLVGRSSTNTPQAGSAGSSSLMDDWGSDMAWLQPKADPVPALNSLSLQAPSAQTRTTNVTRTSTTSGSSKLNARPVPSARFDSSAFPVDSPTIHAAIPPPRIALAVAQPNHNPSTHFSPMVPTLRTDSPLSTTSGPNYNISLTPNATPPYSASPASNGSNRSFPNARPPTISAQPPALVPSKPLPPGFSSGVLQPDAKPAWKPTTSKTADWADFDPLK